MVALIGVVPELVALNPAMLPDPLAARPMAVLELVQVKVAPAVVLVKLVAATAALLHTIMFAGTVTTGVGFTVMV